MLCHLGIFSGGPLMSESILLRTVWKYQRLFLTDAFMSAMASNSRLCVARRPSAFQKVIAHLGER